MISRRRSPRRVAGSIGHARAGGASALRGARDLAAARAVAAELAGRRAVSLPDRARRWWRSARPGSSRDWSKRTAQRTSSPFADRRGLMRVAAYLGALVFYAGSLEFLGFIVATAITVTFILRFAERYSWLRDAGADRRHGDRLPDAVRALARRHPADRNAVGEPVPSDRGMDASDRRWTSCTRSRSDLPPR